MYKPTFLNQNRPFVMGIVLKDNPQDMRFAVKNSIYQGADALGIQLCRLSKEYHNKETYMDIFSACGGRPIYVTNYSKYQNDGLSDEECMKDLKLAMECGGTLADIMGDAFDKSDMELTRNQKAIDKQMKLIDELHEMGKEVLLSSHVLRYIPAETVIEIALEQQRRGADIAKIVTAADSEEEQMENLRITTLLKKELDIPFVFLSGGTHTKIHRMVGPQLGCFAYLAVYEHSDKDVPTQPTVAAAKAVRDNFDYMPDMIY